MSGPMQNLHVDYTYTPPGQDFIKQENVVGPPLQMPQPMIPPLQMPQPINPPLQMPQPMIPPPANPTDTGRTYYVVKGFDPSTTWSTRQSCYRAICVFLYLIFGAAVATIAVFIVLGFPPRLLENSSVQVRLDPPPMEDKIVISNNGFILKHTN